MLSRLRFRLSRGLCVRLSFLTILFLIANFMLFRSSANNNDTREIHGSDLNVANGPVKADQHGFLTLPFAQLLCRAQNWKPYPSRDKRRKIYDLFMLNGELDWLNIRLNELKDHVDYFVIVESATTFTGIPKPLYMKENWIKLRDFQHKIIYGVLNDTELQSKITWDHEDLQRNAMYDQVFPGLEGEQKPNLGDVILVSDVDEIPRPGTLTLLRNCDYNRRLTLRSKFYYYGFQWQHRGGEWTHPQATYYEGEGTIRPANLRNGEGGNSLMRKFETADLANSSWHCSFCFATLGQMLNKISSFSHTTLNKPEFRERAGLVRRVRHGLDLFDRPEEFYDRVDNNEDVPSYLKEHRKTYAYMLDRDPANANFRDLSLEEAEAEAARVVPQKTNGG